MDLVVLIILFLVILGLGAAFRVTVQELRKRNADLAQANRSMQAEIEERRRAEELLNEKENQYRSIFQSVSDGLLITDLAGRLIDFNPVCSHMHGYTEEEFRSLEPRQFIHPDSWPVFERFLVEVGQGKEFREWVIHLHQDGRRFPVEVNGRLFTYQGQPRALAVMRDVTQQLEAYQLLEQRVDERTRELSALLDLSHRLASTLEVNPLVAVVLDQLKGMVDYSSAVMFFLDGDHLEIAGQRQREDCPPGEAASSLFLFDSPEGQAWLQNLREPLVVPDTEAAVPDASALRQAMGPAVEMRCMRSWMWVPLQLKGRLLGGLSLENSEVGYYTDRHARLALAIANQAAITLENARLYEQAQYLAALEERQRLARELHDSVSQALYGIALGARTARTLLDRDPAIQSGLKLSLTEPLDYCLSLADAGLAEMRALIFELRPESLETEGLVAALSKQAAALQARHGLKVITRLSAEPEIPLPAKETLYRVAQEALHNVAKHAQASRVEVQLSQEDGRVCLSIVDDGRGFDATSSFPGHLGLKSMHERIERRRGSFAIESAPGQGTRLTATLPLHS